MSFKFTKGSSYWESTVIEVVRGIRPEVTPDVISNSPFVSQVNTRQFGRRI